MFLITVKNRWSKWTKLYGISNHFKTIYSALYNSVDDANEIAEIAAENESKINFLSLMHVEKVTPKVVKEAASNLGDSKSDPTFSFNSD